ncbi:MAG: serine/threonine-protein kinase [Acidobacteria bacterium]|nr:serine/threonine-protein kinase [Acidobacteriota bacterium]
MPDGRQLVDVADAISSDQEVDWNRARRALQPAQRRTFDNLRAVSAIFGTRREPVASLSSHTRDERGTKFVRLALGLLVAVSAFLATEGMVRIAWSGERYFNWQFALPQLAAFVSIGACALLLLRGSRFDHRARLLGAFFAVSLSSFALTMSPLAALGLGWNRPVVLPEVFSPTLMWAFAREFPRVHLRTRIDDVARRMVPISTVVGGALWFVNATPLLTWTPVLARARDDGLYWLVLAILILPALGVLALRARGAKADEARRAALFIGGIVVGLGPIFLIILIALSWPAARQFGIEHQNALGIVVFPALLSIPFSTSYAVLSRRALDIRLVVRASYRRLLTRRLLAVLGGAPLAGLVWMLASQPARTVGDLMSEPLALLFVAASGIAAMAAGVRRRLLTYLDAWVDPEAEDQRRVLAAASGTLAQATSAARVSEAVNGAVRRGVSAPATLFVAAGEAGEYAHQFTAPNGQVASLARTSALVHVMESTREPLPVDPDDGTSAFELLPRDDAEWVQSSSAAVVAPVIGPGAEINGLMVVGRRFDDRALPVDRTFLAALAAPVGLALDRLRLLQAPNKGAVDTQPASECPVCGIVAPEDDERRCNCGVAYDEAPAPAFLAGKFRIDRRLGAGGMGVVYLAHDVRLARDVAVKTLPALAGQGLARLQDEARTMAAQAHPAIAQVYGLETWRGRPLLIVELLSRGTLAARIARGPLSATEAVAVAVTVAEALEELHGAGYLHGDIKPSNIGFTSDGTTKLLDFGLAHLTDERNQPAGGTVLYTSPELLAAGAARAADDVWARSVVLYEMVAGRHPFIGGDRDAVVGRIRRQRIQPGGEPGDDASAKVLSAARAILTARPSERPATARAFADRLRGS